MSNESEKKLAKKDGAKLVANSGRGWQKGDAILPPFLVDYKVYTSSFSISKKNWKKHQADAWDQSEREPLIAVILDGDTRLAVIDWDIFRLFLDHYMENVGWH